MAVSSTNATSHPLFFNTEVGISDKNLEKAPDFAHFFYLVGNKPVSRRSTLTTSSVPLNVPVACRK